MIKQIPIPELCKTYYAEDATGRILRLRGGEYKPKATFFESGNKKPKVRLWHENQTRRKYFVGFLVLGTFSGQFKDLRCWELVYKNGDYTDSRYENLEWRQRDHDSFYDFLTDIEYVLWNRKLNSMPADEWEKFNDWAMAEHRKAEPMIKDDTERLLFFEQLFKVPEVKIVTAGKGMNFINMG